MNGRIIAIEGADGSGKATQSKLLFNNLKKKRLQALMLAFPNYNSLTGKLVKKYLNNKFGDLEPALAAVLYAGNRLEFKNRINKALLQRKTVIINRYVGSNQIHQASRIHKVDRKKFINWIEDLEYKSFGLPKADLTIFLSVPTSFTKKLVIKRGNKADILEVDQKHQEAALTQGRSLAKLKGWKIIECVVRDKLLKPLEINKLVMKEVYARLRS